MILRAVLVWVGLAVAITLNGMIRELLYRPYMGPVGAQALSSLIAIAIVLVISRAFVKSHPQAPHALWGRIGLLWGFLTLAFELLLGRFGTRLTWQEMFSNYNIFAGSLWPFVLLTIFLAPPFWSRRLYRRRSAGLYFRP